MELKYFFTKRFFLSLAAIFFGSSLTFAATAIPTLTKPVVDTADIISEETEALLDEQILALERDTTAQIAVVTIPSLADDETIEEFSERTFNTWKLGQKELNNGALLAIALEQHKVRIEVGYGLEGSLTDTKCGIIIRNFITPYFKQDDYNSGIQNGVNAMVGVIIEDEELNAKIEELAMSAKKGSAANILIPLGMFATFFGLVGFSVAYSKKHGKPSTSSSASLSHSFDHDSGGGHWHSSDSDGGGYSGGGGSSGGGGASGSW